MKCLSSDFCADSCCGFLVAGFFEEGKHIFLVSLNAGLVERIYTEDVAADTACSLEEVDELAEDVLADFGEDNSHIGYTAVNVGDTCAELCHLVYLVDTLAGDVVETVEIGLVKRNAEFVVALLNREHSLEDGAFAILNPLTH